MSRRKVSQIALALLAWVLFGYYWWLVSRRRLNPETVTALSSLAVIIGSLCLITLVWIRHNLQLAKRAGGRRKSRRTPPSRTNEDSLGRSIERGPDGNLYGASYVELSIDEETKNYRIVDPTSVEQGSP